MTYCSVNYRADSVLCDLHTFDPFRTWLLQNPGTWVLWRVYLTPRRDLGAIWGHILGPSEDRLQNLTGCLGDSGSLLSTCLSSH